MFTHARLTIPTIALAVAAPAMAAYQVGDIVDDFTLVDHEGISHSLYDYKGQIIVLNFGEYWCGPCLSEWAVMKSDFWNPNKDQGVMMLTIGSDLESQFNAKADLYSGGIDDGGWPWLFDAANSLYWDYGDGYIPFNAILDQDFRLVWSDSGWSGNFNTPQAQIDANLADVVIHQIDPLMATIGAGANADFNITLTNRTGSPKTFDVIFDAILPSHATYGPIESQSVTLPGNVTVTAPFTYPVPGSVPNGSYRARFGLEQGGDYSCAALNYTTIQ